MSALTYRSARPRRHHAKGFTLIEIMVSLLIFSVGILGLAGFQALATRNTVEASERSRAALMANELIALMWAEHTTSTDKIDFAGWQERVADNTSSGLNEGKGEVVVLGDSAASVLITITWASVARAGETSTYYTEFTVPPDTE